MAGDTKKKAQQKVKDSATGVEVAVPQPPKRLSAYQIFVQQQRDATKAHNPSANSQEILGILAKAWNGTGADERAKLEKDADEDLETKKKMWAVGEDIREAERLRVCKALDMSDKTTWASLYEKVVERNEKVRPASPRSSNPYKPPPSSAASIKKSRQ